ncbi:heterokaryon incompatibility protein-domain-containing protein [Apiospora marii]|uniref:Heterokaryon incompatibility protein-domain-containing protein n=1 Tax=Apiospora marii TaxID=335849 RepID=A0ABR1RV79_9PEZI
MSTIANSYPGCPLDEEDSFRVIEIQPGERDEPVTVRLVTTTLRNCPPYEALSYAWGDLTQTELIQVVTAKQGHNDSPEAQLSITVGCADALRRLRSGTATRTLWVDSICINQSLVPERNQQLQLMPRIYSSASRVVIYLGESSGADGSDAIMDWLREIHEPSDDSSDHVPEPNLGVLREFLGRRWFTRVWVLQEIRLARQATVVCGEREVAWDAFRELRDWQRNNRVSIGPHRAWTLPYTVQSLASDPTGPFLPPYPARLLRLLVDTRDLGATDERDKLFAILPLLAWESDRHREACLAADTSDEYDNEEEQEREGEKQEEEEKEEETDFMTPACDYERQPAEIFMQLARDLVNAFGLEVLTCAAAPTTIPGLPSWAPDWGTKTPPTSRNKSSAYGGLELRSPGNLFVISGGTIARIGDVCDVYSDYFPLEQWEGLCDPAHLEDGPGDPGSSERWRHRSSRFVKALFHGKVRYEDVAIRAVAAIREYELEKSGSRPTESTASLLGEYVMFAAQDTALVDIFQTMSPSAQRQTELVFQCCHMQRLFVTDAGYLGLAPEAARVGDRVVAIKGLDVLFVVRTEGAGDDDGAEAVRLIGTCYREVLSLEAEGEGMDHLTNYEEQVIR